MAAVDLTPFGYTPTESRAYQALLRTGPASGYAVAKALSIARANAYQALDGLVGKGAAVLLEGSPGRYRALAPNGLLARITRQMSARLDRLERQLQALGGEGASDLIPFQGTRAFQEIALRLTARAPGPVRCLAPEAVLETLLPIWRKRAADGTATELWALGPAPEDYPIPLRGAVPADALQGALGPDTIFVLTPEAALLATGTGAAVQGYWASDPLLVAALDAALQQLTTMPT